MGTPDQLSRRERQIAEAYAAGRSYREIARLLFIAPTTVRTHLGTIYRKLSVSSKIELLRIAIANKTVRIAWAILVRRDFHCAATPT